MNTEHLHHLIATGETDDALAQLATWTQSQQVAWKPAVLLLQASWTYVEKQLFSGVISNQEAERIRNRITQGTLHLIESIHSGTTDPKEVLKQLQHDFNDKAMAKIIKQNKANLSGNNIHIQDSAEVLIGSGNSIRKKIFTAFGIRQFIFIAVALIILLGGGYYISQNLLNKQDDTYLSLQAIHKEMRMLADLNSSAGARIEANKASIENQLNKGMQALQAKDYATSVQYLERVAEQAPLASVHQNLAYAYAQLGDSKKVQENLAAAKKINPNLDVSFNYTQLKGKRINLLALENGGKMLAASKESIKMLTDGDTYYSNYLDNKAWAVFGFKDGRAATFDQFGFYVASSSNDNIQTFELLYGNDSPTGNFISIGKYKIFNGFLSETPFQPFQFPKVKAKYFKFQLIEKHGLAYEFELLGTLE